MAMAMMMMMMMSLLLLKVYLKEGADGVLKFRLLLQWSVPHSQAEVVGVGSRWWPGMWVIVHHSCSMDWRVVRNGRILECTVARWRCSVGSKGMSLLYRRGARWPSHCDWQMHQLCEKEELDR